MVDIISLYARNRGPNHQMTDVDISFLLISLFWMLSSVIFFVSILVRLSKKGVLVLTIWNSHLLIGIFIMMLLIEVVKPMPNMAVTAPS